MFSLKFIARFLTVKRITQAFHTIIIILQFFRTQTIIDNALAALKHTVGLYILNGNWTNSWPGDYEGAGTVFTYRKENGNLGESIFATGPLSESVDLIVITTYYIKSFIIRMFILLLIILFLHHRANKPSGLQLVFRYTNPGIKYEYKLPLDAPAQDESIAPPLIRHHSHMSAYYPGWRIFEIPFKTQGV